MNPIYKFYLTIQQERREVFPLYGNDIYKVYSLENDQLYYRTTLDGNFKFIKNDYDFIMSAPFDTTYYVEITKSNDNGRSFSIYFNGKFMRTDCTIDADNKILQTKFTAVDQYENIIAGLEKEYDLIKLKPEIEQVFIDSRPAVQIYVAGDNVITSFVGGTYFEQEADSNDDENFLTNTCGFAKLCLAREIIVGNYENSIGNSDGTNKEVLGRYYSKAFNNAVAVDVNTGTLIEPLVYQKADDPNIFFEFTHAGGSSKGIGVKIYKKVSGQNIIILNTSYTVGDGVINPAQNVTITDDTGAYRVYYINNAIYGRILHNKDGDYTCVSNDDITEVNTYKYITSLPVIYGNYVYISGNVSEEPTEYGIRQPGEYFTKPEGITSLYPVGRSQWVNTSIWFSAFTFDDMYNSIYSESFILKHAFPLHSCIQRLLAEVAPELKFENNILYSNFLFADKNPISADTFRLYITPKTNILKGEYDQPAQKAPITLKAIFGMLRDCFRCYWYVDNSKLRIEHVSYFRNGLNYISSIEPGLNLLKVIEPKLNKPWTFATNEYKFEKSKMPERYQFEWMDDQTEPFDGLPIDVISCYTEKGSIENVSISKFSSDIDMAMVSPSAFSNDGFFLLAVNNFSVLDPSAAIAEPITANYKGDFGDKFFKLNKSLFNINTDIKIKVTVSTTASSVKNFKVVCVRFIQNNPIYDRYTVMSPIISLSAGSFSVELTINKDVEYIGIIDSGSDTPYEVYIQQATTVNLYKPVIIEKEIGDNYYSMQNGLLAFADLQPKYYTKDMPATHVNINGKDFYLSPKNTKRNRLQEIKFPSGKNDINPMQLIKTELGNGQIDKVKINLASRIAEATLRHYNE